MKHPALLTLLLLCAFAACACADNEGLFPNPSFEILADSRPQGFRLFTTPADVNGDFFVTDGVEGETTHSGTHAVQFRFPEGAQISQAVWMGELHRGAVAVQPGRYSVTFWIKATEMLEGFHTWVILVGYAADGTRVGEVARSAYLSSKDLPSDEWKQVAFSFEIPSDQSVASVVPSIVFKTHPNSSINSVPPGTRVIVDDLVLTRD